MYFVSIGPVCDFTRIAPNNSRFLLKLLSIYLKFFYN